MDLTAFAIVFHILVLFGTAGAAVIAYNAARDAEAARLSVGKELAKVLALRGQIVGHESSLDSLAAQVQKLRGQFFAFKTSVEAEQPEEPASPVPSRQIASFTAAPFCPNYGLAQIEGPLSKAAACECGYCAEMRNRRDAARRELLPKTANEQAQRTREMADGQG